MAVAEQIRQKLDSVFAPTHLEVVDESEQHRGHGGWREGGESHFRVVLRAAAMAPLSRIARHRAIHAALGADLVGRIHALSLDLGPPEA